MESMYRYQDGILREVCFSTWSQRVLITSVGFDVFRFGTSGLYCSLSCSKRAGALVRWGSNGKGKVKKVIRKNRKEKKKVEDKVQKSAEEHLEEKIEKNVDPNETSPVRISKLTSKRTRKRREKGLKPKPEQDVRHTPRNVRIEKEKAVFNISDEKAIMDSGLADMSVIRLQPSVPRRTVSSLTTTRPTTARLTTPRPTQEVDLFGTNIYLSQRKYRIPTPPNRAQRTYVSLSEDPSLLSVEKQGAVDAPVSNGLVGDVVQIYHSWPGQRLMWRNVQVEEYCPERDLHLLRFSNGSTDWVDLRTSQLRFPELD